MNLLSSILSSLVESIVLGISYVLLFVPLLYIDSHHGRVVYGTVMTCVLTVVGGILHYSGIAAPIRQLSYLIRNTQRSVTGKSLDDRTLVAFGVMPHAEWMGSSSDFLSAKLRVEESIRALLVHQKVMPFCLREQHRAVGNLLTSILSWQAEIAEHYEKNMSPPFRGERRSKSGHSPSRIASVTTRNAFLPLEETPRDVLTPKTQSICSPPAKCPSAASPPPSPPLEKSGPVESAHSLSAPNVTDVKAETTPPKPSSAAEEPIFSAAASVLGGVSVSSLETEDHTAMMPNAGAKGKANGTPRPELGPVVLDRGGRFTTDNHKVFLHLTVKQNEGAETTVGFEAFVETNTSLDPNQRNSVNKALRFKVVSVLSVSNQLPFESFSVNTKGNRAALSSSESALYGFKSCELEEAAAASLPLFGNDKPLPSQTTESVPLAGRSYILAWSILPKLPMRLTLLPVQLKGSTGALPIPVLECMIDDVFCVLTSAVVELGTSTGILTRKEHIDSVELHGVSIEDADTTEGSETASQPRSCPFGTAVSEKIRL